jgi:7-cyano-7-deazaguanine synthase
MIMLSVAAGFAISQGAQNLCIANHSGDHAIYPDCRLEFIEAVSEVLKLCHFTPLYIMAPFTNISKADICKKGIELGVPFENTWSCYKGGEKHCGKCGTCVERKEAFELIGVQDPTEYEENK